MEYHTFKITVKYDEDCEMYRKFFCLSDLGNLSNKHIGLAVYYLHENMQTRQMRVTKNYIHHVLTKSTTHIIIGFHSFWTVEVNIFYWHYGLTEFQDILYRCWCVWTAISSTFKMLKKYHSYIATVQSLIQYLFNYYRSYNNYLS